MSVRFSFHPLVHSDIDQAYQWYERQRRGLGGEFLDDLERTQTKITANPARFGFAAGDIREGQLDRFPYVIYYRVMTNSIRVLAVYHTARDSEGWQSRS